jgi:hypothetical protein
MTALFAELFGHYQCAVYRALKSTVLDQVGASENLSASCGGALP